METSNRADVLLVAEHGTRWMRWMDELAAAKTGVAVIIQRSREPHGSFAQRVRDRASVLAARGSLPPTVLFVGSGRADLPVVHARAAIACGIVAALASAAPTRLRGRLLLTSDRTGAHDGYAEMKRAAVAAAARFDASVHVADARPLGEAIAEPAARLAPVERHTSPDLLPAA